MGYGKMEGEGAGWVGFEGVDFKKVVGCGIKVV